MAGSQNTEFGAGVNHVTNQDRGNDNSVTLGGSLQADSDGWNAMTPRAVLSSATGTGLDYAGTQRIAGSYAPGSMGRFSDELSGGSDSYQSDEE